MNKLELLEYKSCVLGGKILNRYLEVNSIIFERIVNYARFIDIRSHGSINGIFMGI